MLTLYIPNQFRFEGNIIYNDQNVGKAGYWSIRPTACVGPRFLFFWCSTGRQRHQRFSRAQASPAWIQRFDTSTCLQEPSQLAFQGKLKEAETLTKC